MELGKPGPLRETASLTFLPLAHTLSPCFPIYVEPFNLVMSSVAFVVNITCPVRRADVVVPPQQSPQ